MSAAARGVTVTDMAIEVRDLNAEDEQELRDYHGVVVRAETEDGRDWTRPWKYDEFLQEIREPDPNERCEMYVALDGGRVVGAGLHYFFLADNLAKTWLAVLVDPPERRRGIGSALVEYAVERARAEGRTEITAETSFHFEERETSGVLAFAKRHDFEMALMQIRRRLDLPVDEALLEEIAEEAAGHQGDYVVESYVHGVPAELLPSYCDLDNLLAIEAPSGDFNWEPDSTTPELFVERLAKLAAVGRTRYTTLARLGTKVVALTDIVVTEGEAKAEQWSTIVDRDHRGHRLGAAVKVANLRQVVAAHPELTAVQTENAETNAQMVGINERLGFRAVAVEPGFLRRL